MKHLLFLCSGLLLVGSLRAQHLGQWDFTNGDLSPTLGGEPLQYADGPGGQTEQQSTFGTTDVLGIPAMDGTHAAVLCFPASNNGMGFNMPNPPNPNGIDSYGYPLFFVNSYTIIMDVLYPAASDSVRPEGRTLTGQLVILCLLLSVCSVAHLLHPSPVSPIPFRRCHDRVGEWWSVAPKAGWRISHRRNPPLEHHAEL